jgi:NADH-quinone oxidoreductase subunit C
LNTCLYERVDYIGEINSKGLSCIFLYPHLIPSLNKVRIGQGSIRFCPPSQDFGTSQFYEQEIHEFFGIVFEGNKDLSGLFLENWLDIPPFRKDFNTREFAIKGLGANVNGGEE